MQSKKLIAAGAAGALVFTGIASGVANAASLANQNYSSAVVVFGNPQAPQSYQLDVSASVPAPTSGTEADGIVGETDTFRFSIEGPPSFAPQSQGDVDWANLTIDVRANGVPVTATPVPFTGGYTGVSGDESPAILGGAATPLPQFEATYTYTTPGTVDWTIDGNFFTVLGGGAGGVEATQTAVDNNVILSQTITGPNATIATSTGQNAGVQAVRNPLATAISGYAAPTTITFTGDTWNANITAGDIQAQFCDVTGTTCDNLALVGGVPPNNVPNVVVNTLGSDAGGNITGQIDLTRNNFLPFLTTGNRAIKLTGTNAGAGNVALIPVQVLGTPTITLNPAAGGSGTNVLVQGSNLNPSQAVTVNGYFEVYGGGTGPLPATVVDTVGTTASATGTYSATLGPLSSETKSIYAIQGTGDGFSAANVRAGLDFTWSSFKCTAATGNTNGSCPTNQNIIFDVLEGNLTQLAFITGVNTDATIVDLGAITVPFVNTVLSGDLNTIQVADNRGGSFGWALSAVMTDFDSGTYTVDAGQLVATPSCADATDIYDYANYTNPNALPPVLGTVDGSLQEDCAAGAGGALDNVTAISLATKAAGPGGNNATTQSTSGVYNVPVDLDLTVPAFQAADLDYTATMTITLVG